MEITVKISCCIKVKKNIVSIHFIEMYNIYVLNAVNLSESDLNN